MNNLLFIDWQPSVDALALGSVHFRWYSLLWCIGLFAAYLIVQKLYSQQKIEDAKFEPLFFYCFFGVLIGARLGHCLFYEPQYYLTSGKGLMEMILPMHQMQDGSWKFTGYEGLASHGGTIGLFLALMMYWKKKEMRPWVVLDNIAIAVPFTACCIRLGNLMNSEIIGNQTDVPWAFIFHTREALVNGVEVPRHPAQLYEAIAYLIFGIIGVALYAKWRKDSAANRSVPFSVEEEKKRQEREATHPFRVGSGFYFGFCLATIFIFRFFVEFVKKEQVAFEESMALDMGQILSIPMIIVGVWCMINARKGKLIKE